jgi:Tfp pilus assembly protein PilF
MLELAPKNPGFYSLRAHAYLREQKSALAIADFTRAIELSPRGFAFLRFRGDVYKTTKQYDLAIADYRKALTLNIPAPIRTQFENALKDLGATP